MKRTKLAHRNCIATFGHRHQVALRADVDTRGVEVDVLQMRRQLSAL